MDMFFTQMAVETGWSFSTVCGGPVPKMKGKITSASYHEGITETGNNFGVAYPSFDDAWIAPYQKFLREIYRE